MLVVQSCPTLCNPMDCSMPGSSVHGLSQARILEWIARSFSRGFPHSGIKPKSPALQVDTLLSDPTREVPCTQLLLHKIQWHTMIATYSQWILTYSQKLFVSMGVQVGWGTLHHLSYLGVQARGAEAMWSMIFIVKVKGSQIIEQKHLIHLKTYIWNSSSGSSGQSIWNLRSMRYVNGLCLWRKCSDYLLNNNANIHNVSFILMSPDLVHLFFSAFTVGWAPSMFTLILSWFGPSRIPLWNHAIFVTVSLPSLPAISDLTLSVS